MLKLSAKLHADIMRHGAAAYPDEGCGLLLGHGAPGENVVTAVQPLDNVWPNVEERRVRFRIDPDAWRDAELQAALEGVDVIGIFHSHPDHPPIASPRDLAWATWPGYSYLITQIVDGKPTLSRSWQLLPDRSGFIEEQIEIITSTPTQPQNGRKEKVE